MINDNTIIHFAHIADLQLPGILSTSNTSNGSIVTPPVIESIYTGLQSRVRTDRRDWSMIVGQFAKLVFATFSRYLWSGFQPADAGGRIKPGVERLRRGTPGVRSRNPFSLRSR